MSIVQFNKDGSLQNNCNLTQVSNNVIEIILTQTVTEEVLLSGFKTLNEHNLQIQGEYPDYNTIYEHSEENAMLYRLSNDESVYIPPVKPEPLPEPEPYVPTLDEIKVAKKSELSSMCQQVVYNGIDVELSTGIEHFTLKIEDQVSLFGKQLQVSAGMERIEYHESTIPTSPCKYYSLADMTLIIGKSMSFVSYHTTYCNSLYVWIDALNSKEDVENIHYGINIPVEYQSEVLKDYIMKMS